MGDDGHSLDTSVVLHLLTAEPAYRRFLESAIGPGPREVSGYVVMELRRGFLHHLMAFYDCLDMPYRRTLGDALAFWKNHYAGGPLKAVLALVAEMVESHGFRQNYPEDKAKTLQQIVRYIKRYEMKVRGLSRGSDATRCARATIPMKVAGASASRDFYAFTRRFLDSKACRSSCRIDEFLLQDYRLEVEAYRDQAAKAPKSKEGKGFARIGRQLGKILNKGASVCTCRMCALIGDAVIALDAPRETRLETTDYSFDHLCPPIAQPHRRHASAQAVDSSLREKAAQPTSSTTDKPQPKEPI